MKWVFSWVDGAQREAVILASQLSGSHPVTSSQFGVVGHSAIQTTMSCLLHLLLKKSRGRKSAWALCFGVCACMSVLTKDCESPLDYTLKLLLCECCLYLSSTYFALFVLSLSLSVWKCVSAYRVISFPSSICHAFSFCSVCAHAHALWSVCLQWDMTQVWAQPSMIYIIRLTYKHGNLFWR